jgi:hypothetical protein
MGACGLHVIPREVATEESLGGGERFLAALGMTGGEGWNDWRAVSLWVGCEKSKDQSDDGADTPGGIQAAVVQ